MADYETQLAGDDTQLTQASAADYAPATDLSSTILKARIALLSTAIGGPDHSSELDPPPYKLGDDCLACLKDLKRWFRLVDDQQNRWDVAAAAAEYNVLTGDLLPILVDWENKSAHAARQARKSTKSTDGNTDPSVYFKNKAYYDKIALNALQLMVLMTWPLILTDQSSANHVNHYSELKKHQLVYKKAILSVERGKVLRAAIRIALRIVQTERRDRTPRDNVILRLVLNFFRNVLAIEPGELTISSRKTLSKGINSTDTLPPSVSMDDVSLNSAVVSFERNKVFAFLLTLASTMDQEFDAAFINVPLLELVFYLTKDVDSQELFKSAGGDGASSGRDSRSRQPVPAGGLSRAGAELSQLLKKEHQLKKSVIRNTSTRHSRFGSLLSIQTPDHGRLTVSGARDLLNSDAALQKLDASKKWNKRVVVKYEAVEGLSSSFLNTEGASTYLSAAAAVTFRSFVDGFVDSSFNGLLRSVTDHFTTEDDRMVTLHRIQYMLFFGWFARYQRLRCAGDPAADIACVSTALEDTSFVLVSQLLRKGAEQKNWPVVHAGMIAFEELLLLLNSLGPEHEETAEHVKSRLFSDDRIQLLASLPKTASRHSPQYVKSCVRLTHVVLKTLEEDSRAGRHLVVQARNRRRRARPDLSDEAVRQLAEEEGVGYDEALETLESSFRQVEVNFARVQSAYIVETTVQTYVNFLQRFRELGDDDIKKAIQFLHRVFVQAKEESFLFRMDFMILLKDMLGPDGLGTGSRSRKHVARFCDYYMARLKQRFKKAPSWYVNVLFAVLHDKEVGYYQRYDEFWPAGSTVPQGVPPSVFRRIEDEEMMSNDVVADLKCGILVSALIDDGKSEMVDEVLANLQRSLALFKAWLAADVQAERETEHPPNERFQTDDPSVRSALLLDRDFRALLLLTGYRIPAVQHDPCYLPGTTEITAIEASVSLLQKHISTPFQTPNGQPSSSYLIRPRTHRASPNSGYGEDGWSREDGDNYDYDYNEPGIVRDDEGGDADDYFRELEDGMSQRLEGRTIAKGTARSKQDQRAKKMKKGRERKRSRHKTQLPTFDTGDGPLLPDKDANRHVVVSKEYISDSDDDDGAGGGGSVLNSVFFENEMYLRWLLDKHRGQLSDSKYAEFARFNEDRMRNNGRAVGDHTSLFDGPVPPVAELMSAETGLQRPDQTFLTRAETQSALAPPGLALREGEFERDGADGGTDDGDTDDGDTGDSDTGVASRRKKPRRAISDDEDDVED